MDQPSRIRNYSAYGSDRSVLGVMVSETTRRPGRDSMQTKDTQCITYSGWGRMKDWVDWIAIKEGSYIYMCVYNERVGIILDLLLQSVKILRVGFSGTNSVNIFEEFLACNWGKQLITLCGVVAFSPNLLAVKSGWSQLVQERRVMLDNLFALVQSVSFNNLFVTTWIMKILFSGRLNSSKNIWCCELS